MPRGIYPRKSKVNKYQRRAPIKEAPIELLVPDTDASRLDMLERLSDTCIYKPRFDGELVVVRCGTAFGTGITVRDALDDLAKRG